MKASARSKESVRRLRHGAVVVVALGPASSPTSLIINIPFFLIKVRVRE